MSLSVSRIILLAEVYRPDFTRLNQLFQLWRQRDIHGRHTRLPFRIDEHRFFIQEIPRRLSSITRDTQPSHTRVTKCFCGFSLVTHACVICEFRYFPSIFC